jgi:hypothetical protein
MAPSLLRHLQLNFLTFKSQIHGNLLTHTLLQHHDQLALVKTRLSRSAVHHLQQQTKRDCNSKLQQEFLG